MKGERHRQHVPSGRLRGASAAAKPVKPILHRELDPFEPLEPEKVRQAAFLLSRDLIVEPLVPFQQAER